MNRRERLANSLINRLGDEAVLFRAQDRSKSLIRAALQHGVSIEGTEGDGAIYQRSVGFFFKQDSVVSGDFVVWGDQSYRVDHFIADNGQIQRFVMMVLCVPSWAYQ
jgi:class 3 adenylate cyclase